jgi:hypothetical protein|uniref:Uncharacterized protein n=1 Tax=Picea glauca TaxID=3330 RepID=A0A117NIF8_PICGL|nr:hypothetical protein ABT39_MTgene3123 [Picea glauca]QHR86459.1 hypothetical protein Q903MT_gene459 [Picea sitchensis]
MDLLLTHQQLNRRHNQLSQDQNRLKQQLLLAMLLLVGVLLL